MQVGVLHRDGQAKAAAADGTVPGRVGPPKPVEHLLGLTGLEANAVVAHRHSHRELVAGHKDVDRPTLAVLDGVDQQVAQDPLDPASFFLYETYDNEAAFKAHLQTEHFKTFTETVAPWTASKHMLTYELISGPGQA